MRSNGIFYDEDSGGSSGSAGSSGESGQDQTIVIDLDGEEKSFSAEDVKGLVAEQAAVTAKGQEAAAIIDAANKYGITPTKYLEQSEGAFDALSELRTQGVINENGEVVVKAEVIDDPSKGKGTPPGLPTSGLDEKTLRDLELVSKAVGEMSELKKEVSSIRKDNVALLTLRLQDKLVGEHKDLTKDDATTIIAAARSDSAKTLDQHAKDHMEKKQASVSLIEKAFAEKHGIDIEALAANELDESAPDGGAGTIIEGYDLSFKRGEKKMSPLKATQEYFKKLHRG